MARGTGTRGGARTHSRTRRVDSLPARARGLQLTDRTLEICREYTDRIYSRKWNGHSEQKQFALERCTGEWVLNIDSDEEVSTELKSHILRVLSAPKRKRNWSADAANETADTLLSLTQRLRIRIMPTLPYLSRCGLSS